MNINVKYQEVMKNKYILLLFGLTVSLLWSCQKDKLPVTSVSEATVVQLAGTWSPVKHQLNYWKLNENIVQRGSDTTLVYENTAINSDLAFYNGVPCDTLILNSDKTWAIKNRRITDVNSGKDLTPTTSTETISGAKTTTLLKQRVWTVTQITDAGSSDYTAIKPYLELITVNTQTVKETGKLDIVTKWNSVNKGFTLQSIESGKVVIGYQQIMSVSFKPGVLPGQPDQKTNRNVTNTVTFVKQ
jgi:hypothetical protein